MSWVLFPKASAADVSLESFRCLFNQNSHKFFALVLKFSLYGKTCL